jgi:hypothetical protein
MSRNRGSISTTSEFVQRNVRIAESERAQIAFDEAESSDQRVPCEVLATLMQRLFGAR